MSDISFNNSKITKICYHGTDSAPFTVLDKTKIQKDPDEGDAGYFGWGFYLTTDLEYAKTFGKNILKFKVNIQNPFDFNDADYDKLVEFVFNDSDKKLNSHIHDTMYFLRQVGNNKKLEYKNNNSEEIRKQCLDIYHKYKSNKSFTQEELNEISSLLVILAKNLNNWLNGLFFYFGREIFHYFTSNGFDGVIVLNGKEVVVYETKQLEPVQDEELRIVEDTNNKPTKSQVLNDLLDVFGEADINELSDAVYILPNGKVLDTKGDSVVSQHENISIYLEKKYNIKDISKDGGSKFMNSIGAIRVTPWIPAIVVPSIKMTEKQDDVLFSIVKHFSVKVSADKPLMISSEDGKQYIEYTKIGNPEEVITAILGYQILGILKEKLAPGKEHKFLNRLN